ncbi:MAG: glycohydrolase toxin TNT-related protein, partial [Verrucomicrobia bacterium]|nr:glycohydrolase toxin TNT-related protein [Verrucomicrobiota bacterium]
AFDGQPTVYWDPDGRFGKPVLQAQWRNANAAAGWAVDQFVNVFAGSGYVLNQAAYRVTGEPGFAASAMAYQREMSPYARQGYYNPNTPTAKLATTATIFVSPESSAGRLGTVDSAVTRNVAPTITREIAPITKPAAIQGGVMNNSMRLLVAPQQPVALLPENTVSLAAGRMTQQRFNFLSKLTSRQWPPNYGFLNQGRATLIPGTMVDRFGSDVGSFVSPVGTPFWQRSLPASFASKPYSVFQVMRPIEVRAGTVAPAFGMAGLGTQFQFHLSVEELVEEGYLNPAQRGF